MPKTVEQLQQDFETFLTQTQDARDLAARDRDYVDHIQWTDTEIAELQKRKQAPVVINRLKVKVNFLVGAERNSRTDPRALPRTPDHEDAADAATDALRFVAQNTDFDPTASECFEDKVVWGVEAAICEMQDVGGEEPEIQINRIDPDRFYWDPHSRKKDFSDAKWMGIAIWMDKEDIKTVFPDVDEAELDNAISTANDAVDGSTMDDQPKWIDSSRKRLKVCQHYYLDGGVWHEVYFTAHLFLIEPKPSQYLDEFGHPDNPIEAQSAYIDRENNRYGEARAYVWVQDEINHRRSKALHQLSVRQTIGDKNAVEDINQAKAELAKANGHIELNVPGARFEILENPDLTQGQLALYQDAKGEIDSIGANSALSGEPDSGSLSGRAIQALQQGGLTELASLFDGHRTWKRRLYRQVWNRISQFWDGEKWIRVTDDESNLKWVGLNQPMTLADLLQEQAEQGSQEATAMLEELLAAGDPRLNEIVETRNQTAELDVDIILTETQDIVTIRQEQFEILGQLAQSYGPDVVPFGVMLKLSDMTNKEQVEDLLEGGDLSPEERQAQQEAAAEEQQLQQAERTIEIEAKGAKAAKDAADAKKAEAEAEAQQIENTVVKGQLAGVLPAPQEGLNGGA